MNNKKILESRRLTLIASTLAHLRTELESPEQLAKIEFKVMLPDETDSGNSKATR